MKFLKALKRVMAVILLIVAVICAILAIVYSGGTATAAVPLIGGWVAGVSGTAFTYLAILAVSIAALLDPEMFGAAINKIAEAIGKAVETILYYAGRATGAGAYAFLEQMMPILLLAGCGLLIYGAITKTPPTQVVRSFVSEEKPVKPSMKVGGNKESKTSSKTDDERGRESSSDNSIDASGNADGSSAIKEVTSDTQTK